LKTIDLTKQSPDLSEVIQMARHEPILLLTQDGKQYYLSEADDFEREVAALRSSKAFQAFLDKRSASRSTISLDEIEKEIERDLAKR